MKKFLVVFAMIGVGVCTIGIVHRADAAQNKVTCPQCGGSKKQVSQCSNCNNGSVRCTACRGNGSTRETCTGCDGTGYLSKTVQNRCSSCSGRGYFTENQQVDCPYCRNGKIGGTQTCSNCGGYGKVSKSVNVSCSACGGRGYSTETTRERHRCDNGYVMRKCSTCNGGGRSMCPVCKGYADIQTDCRKCLGAGYIYVYDASL